MASVCFLGSSWARGAHVEDAVPLECIKEIRSGEDARYYRKEFEQPEEAESRWITVVYILHGTYKTLHILADTRDVFKTWDVTLRKLYSVRQGLTAGLKDPDMRQTVWERQYWKGADEEGDQLLDFDDVERMCKRLHANIPTQQLRIYFTVSGSTNLPLFCANV
jgi:phosphatidylinositol phospholipase C, delta